VGLVWATELPDSDTGYLSHHRHQLKAFALERGIYLRPLGNVAYILPTLASTAAELRRAVEVVAEYTTDAKLA
jgi:adenosylmethionine-8-amino-7-oxononanoate aminotransferase